MTIVGLTGSIASGKSTVSGMFVELGAYLIDYDVLAREVVEPGQKAWEGIVDQFGEEVLNSDSTLNREKLGQIVFDNPEKLQKLNQITHPAVFEEADNRVKEIEKTHADALIIKDVPLLIETGIHNTVDKVIVVSAPRETRLKRLMERGFTQEESLKRIDSQMPISEKEKYADFVIHNDVSLVYTREQVEQIYSQLTDKQIPSL
ncbi:MAG: dephospho-CoA kinase [Chloroflexi bacterium]|nr:dephospho-CoA kinase [Chloroflexota bacterium]